MHSPPVRSTGMTDVREIRIPRPHYANIIGHACRKVEDHYLEGETAERMAFGLLTGTLKSDAIEVNCVFPLIANLRHVSVERDSMDAIVNEHAIPSETANSRRGWVADPHEILAVEQICDRYGWVNFGNYHTHRVSWPDDPLRDTCTGLDRALAMDSGQWVLILSVVDLDKPILRAFYEGCNKTEALIRVVPSMAKAGRHDLYQ
jgi:hypothetical protein